jgi:hypothetical protein
MSRCHRRSRAPISSPLPRVKSWPCVHRRSSSPLIPWRDSEGCRCFPRQVSFRMGGRSPHLRPSARSRPRHVTIGSNRTRIASELDALHPRVASRSHLALCRAWPDRWRLRARAGRPHGRPATACHGTIHAARSMIYLSLMNQKQQQRRRQWRGVVVVAGDWRGKYGEALAKRIGGGPVGTGRAALSTRAGAGHAKACGAAPLCGGLRLRREQLKSGRI